MRPNDFETEFRFNPDSQTVQFWDSDCVKSCHIKDEAIASIQRVLSNPDFECEEDRCQTMQPCIKNSGARCTLTFNRDDNL